MELPKTALEARNKGISLYYTGKPCVHGHIDTRRSNDHKCSECHRLTANKNKKTKREWNLKNKYYFKEKMRKRREKNPEGERKYAREYMRKKYKRPEQKLRVFLGGCIRNLITGKGRATSESLVGYSTVELKQHLEKQFVKGMSWENYGEWHIDHIVPLSHFIKNGIDDPAIVNALTNLRPIWAKDNMAKSSKVEFLL